MTYTKQRRFVAVQTLEDRRMLTFPAFATHDLGEIATIESPRIVITGDIDNDGDEDLVVGTGGLLDNKLVWLENRIGAFTAAGTIAVGMDGLSSVQLADIDGDGDLDAIASSIYDNQVAWHENLDGKGQQWNSHIVQTGDFRTPKQVISEDIDLDGDLDLFVRDYNRISWFENKDGNGTFAEQRVLVNAVDLTFMTLVDFDGDDDIDVTFASNGQFRWKSIGWIENTGSGSFRERIDVIDTRVNSTSMTLAVFDVDQDGDVDVLAASASEESIYMYKNNGNESFQRAQLIDMPAGVRSIQPTDLDYDGDLDLLVNRLDNRLDGESKAVWLRNENGQGRFSSEIEIEGATWSNRVTSINVSDIDADGFCDVIVASYDNRITWHANPSGLGQFSSAQPITSSSMPLYPRSPVIVDIDNDQNPDIAFVNSHGIGWFQSVNGQGQFSPLRQVPIEGSIRARLAVTDIDGDGDTDLLFERYLSDQTTLGWVRNMDGKGDFGQFQPLAETSGQIDFRTADFDGDGDTDIALVTGSIIDRTIVWLENTDGSGTFSGVQRLTQSTAGASHIAVADMDADGDVDIVTLGEGDRIKLHLNDGSGNFDVSKTISSQIPSVFGASITLVDVDGDDDLDVVVGETGHEEAIAWLKNTDGKGELGEIIRFGRRGYVQPADVDHDGDIDFLLKTLGGTWFCENLDGQGTTISEPQLISTFGPSEFDSRNQPLAVGDLNNDGRLDLVATSAFIGESRIAWLKNVVVGDFNGDFKFDSSDLTFLFQSGEYEDAFINNSTFEEGDFNGDGEFNSSDLVLIFQHGNYTS
ncbi:MAG: VCBS repeat-containing protein [Planctomycetales bacterium]|nr:VCBS repeat-containing protein [Planctomycetales bacterium]